MPFLKRKPSPRGGAAVAPRSLRAPLRALALAPLAMGLWMVLTANATASVRGFTERTLALPPGAQPDTVVAELWTDTARDGHTPLDPILFARMNVEGPTFYRTAFAFWRLGERLRQGSGPLAPDTVLTPSPEGLGGGTIRYCLARLAPGEGPSLLLATGRGVIAYPSSYNHPESNGGLVRNSTLSLSRAIFPDADPFRTSSFLAPFVFAVDMNGNGKDELVLPLDEEGHWAVYGGPDTNDYSVVTALPVLRSGSQFVFTLNPPDVAGGKGVEQRRSLAFANNAVAGMRLADVNGNGRMDVMATRPDPNSDNPRDMVFEAYFQQADGAFSQSPDQIIRFRDRESRREWRDLNNDGLMDHIEMQENFDLVSPLMSIDYYLAQGPVTDIRGQEPPRPFRPRNPYGYALFGDWTGNGQLDMAHTYVDKTFGSPKDMAEMMIGRFMGIEIWFYRFENNGYPARPAAQLRMDIRNESLSPLLPAEMVIRMVDDLTGDGHPNLMIRRGPEELWVYEVDLARGRIGRNPAVRFPASAQDFPAATDSGYMPPSRIQNYPLVHDLDRDGRADVWWFDPATGVIRCFLQDEPRRGLFGWW